MVYVSQSLLQRVVSLSSTHNKNNFLLNLNPFLICSTANIMIKAVLAAAVLASAVEGHKAVFSKHTELNEYTFESYKKESGKIYSSPAEEAKRKSIFESNLKSILAHNSGDSSWKRGNISVFVSMFRNAFSPNTIYTMQV